MHKLQKNKTVNNRWRKREIVNSDSGGCSSSGGPGGTRYVQTFGYWGDNKTEKYVRPGEEKETAAPPDSCMDGRCYRDLWPGSTCFYHPCLFLVARWWGLQIALRLDLTKKWIWILWLEAGNNSSPRGPLAAQTNLISIHCHRLGFSKDGDIHGCCLEA